MNATAFLRWVVKAPLLLVSALLFCGCMKPVTLNGSVYENPNYECPVELLTDVKSLLEEMKNGGRATNGN